MKLEELYVEIDARTDKFNDALDEVRAKMDLLEQRAEKAQETIDSFKRMMDKASNTVQNFSRRNQELDRVNQRLNRTLQETGGEIDDNTLKFVDYEQRISKVLSAMESALDRSGKSMSRHRKELDKLRRETDTAVNSNGDLGDSVKDLDRILGRAGKSFANLSKVLNKHSPETLMYRRRIIRLTAAILALIPHVAVLGKGLSGAMIGVAGSLASALASAVPLAGVFAGYGVSLGLAISGMDTMTAKFPGILEQADALKQAWQDQADAFANEWGPSVENILTTLQEKISGLNLGEAMGGAIAEVTEAFDGMLQGEAFAAFMKTMTSEIPAAMSLFGQGIANLGGGLSSLFAASGPAAVSLGESFKAWSGDIAAALEEARKSGELQEFFDGAADSLRKWLGLIGSVGSALGTLFGAGKEHGDAMVQDLTEIVDKFNEWMQSTEGQTALNDFFTSARDIMASVQPLLVGLGQAFDNMITPTVIEQFGNFMTSLGEILPVVGELLGILSEAGIVNAFAYAIQLIGMFLQPLLEPMREIAQVVGPALKSLFEQLGPVFTALGEFLAPVIDTIANILAPILSFVVNEVMPPLIEAFLNLMAALQPIVDFITGVLQVAFQTVFPVIQAIVMTVVNTIIGIINGLTNFFQGLVNFLTGIFSGNWKQVFEGLWQMVKGAFEAIWNFIQLTFIGKVASGIKTALTGIGNFFKSSWDNILNGVKTVFNGIKSTIDNVMNAAKSVITNIINNIKSTFSNGFNAAKSTVTNIFNSIKSTISNIINGAFNVVKGVIDKIKGVFNFNWSLPKLKLPRITISGGFSLMPPKVPKFNIEWFAKGAVLKAPTIFGQNPYSGALMAGGEAGPEAVAPIDVLQSYVSDAVVAANGEMSREIRSLRSMLAEMLPQLANQEIYLDTGALVGGISNRMDSQMGELGIRKERGWR